MKHNVGKIDKIIRIVLAAVFAYLGYTISAWFYILTAALAATSAIGFCGLYALIGINSCKRK